MCVACKFAEHADVVGSMHILREGRARKGRMSNRSIETSSVNEFQDLTAILSLFRTMGARRGIMKLYFAKGACSLACRIIINELGISSEYESVDLHGKAKLTETGADFGKINPKGSVPTLITDDGKTLTENVVILQYLAEQAKATDLLPPANHFEHYRVLEWLNYIAADLHKSFSVFFQPHFPQEIKEQFFLPALKNKFNYVDKHLEQHNFLLGNSFTLPDAYLFVMISWLNQFKINGQWKNLARYHNGLLKRASIQQSLKDEGLFLTPA